MGLSALSLPEMEGCLWGNSLGERFEGQGGVYQVVKARVHADVDSSSDGP